MLEVSKIKFIIPGEPEGKGRHRTTKTGGTYTPPKTARYERFIQRQYNLTCNDEKTITGACGVDIRAYYRIPASATKKKRAAMLAGDIRPTKKPDVDNIAKVVLDALNGIAYKDDAQIVSQSIEKWYSDTPHVEVEIYEL